MTRKETNRKTRNFAYVLLLGALREEAKVAVRAGEKDVGANGNGADEGREDGKVGGHKKDRSNVNAKHHLQWNIIRNKGK